MDKKLILRKHKLICFLFMFLFDTINLFGQPDFDDDVEDVPINNYIPIIIILAIVIVYLFSKKKKLK
ncbi:MAG: hypothetical protein RI980_2246 [Bacteroidota bacterium]|jgi:hypothetical protein